MTTDQNRATNGTRLSGRRSRSNGEHWLTMKTAAWEQLPPNERPYRPGRANAKADGAKVQSWPLVDSQPTKALRVPVPPSKSQPVPEPPMKARDARLMQTLCAVGVAVTLVVAAAALIVRLVAGAS